jgi:hypothetical protein
MRKTLCDIQVDNFMFNIIYFPHHVIDPKPYFFTLSYNGCQNLQWWLGLVGIKIESDGTALNWCKSACWSLFIFPESPIYI